MTFGKTVWAIALGICLAACLICGLIGSIGFLGQDVNTAGSGSSGSLSNAQATIALSGTHSLFSYNGDFADYPSQSGNFNLPSGDYLIKWEFVVEPNKYNKPSKYNAQLWLRGLDETNAGRWKVVERDMVDDAYRNKESGVYRVNGLAAGNYYLYTQDEIGIGTWSISVSPVSQATK